MRKVVAGDEPPAVAVAHVMDVIRKRTGRRRIPAGCKIEFFHIECVLVVLKYAVVRAGIAAVIVPCGELPRDMIVFKDVVLPDHAQTLSALDSNVVAGECASICVGLTVAIERLVGRAGIRAFFRYLPVLVVFAVSDKVDAADAEVYRLRMDPADQRRVLVPVALNHHGDFDIVSPGGRDLDLAGIRVFGPTFLQVHIDGVLAGCCEPFDD